MTYKASCPQCGIVAARPGNGTDTDWRLGPAWDCTCGERFDAIECQSCRRMVPETWFGFCGVDGCEYEPPSPEDIADALHNLERILSS